jgi:prepilin-type N-terminal cleavage/methylation domain-containing protein
VRSSRAGFTLIELLAVVALFALVAALVLPTFDVGSGRAVRREAERLGDAVEFARQRAIMTGRPHLVVLDFEGERHWVEWAPPPSELVDVPVAPAAGRPALELVPPPAASGALEFVPVPGALGRPHPLEDEVVLAEVALAGGALASGEVTLLLGPDGSADPAVIVLSDPEGRRAVHVEMQALADAVVIVDAPQ